MRTASTLVAVCVLMAGATAYLLLWEPETQTRPLASAGRSAAYAPSARAPERAAVDTREHVDSEVIPRPAPLPLAGADVAPPTAEDDRPAPAATTRVRWAGSAATAIDRELAAALAVLQDDPADPVALRNAALGYQSLGRWAMAARGWERLAQQNPDDADVQLSLASAWMRVERWSDALPALRAAAASAPDRLPVWHNLAVTYTALGRLSEAEAAWSRVLNLNAADPDALRGRGEARLDLRDWAGAAADLAACLDLEPEADDTALNLALALARLGQTDEALRRVETVLARVPDHVPALRRAIELSASAWEAGRDTAAARRLLDYAERLLKIIPNDAAAGLLVETVGPAMQRR